MPVAQVKLSELHVDPMFQPRTDGVDRDVVREYAQAIKGRAKFPPLIAYKVTDRSFPKPLLVAGFHRYAAYEEAGTSTCQVDLREGTFAEAWLAGWLSNVTHGLRYTNQDKRQATETALKLWHTDSAPVVAERIAVSDEFVRKVRKEMVAAGELKSVEKVRGKDGREQASRQNRSDGNETQGPTVGPWKPKVQGPAAHAEIAARQHAAPESVALANPKNASEASKEVEGRSSVVPEVLPFPQRDPNAAVLAKVRIVPGERGEQTIPCVRLSEPSPELEADSRLRDRSEVAASARSFLRGVLAQSQDDSGHIVVQREELVGLLEHVIRALDAHDARTHKDVPREEPNAPTLKVSGVGSLQEPLESIAIKDVIVGNRVRKDVGNVLGLAGSIRRLGLLHPIVLNTRLELIAGARRLTAAKKLGWTEIPCRVVECVDDAVAALQAECDENTCREPSTFDELVEVGRRIKELEKSAAKKRARGTRSKRG